MNPHYNRGRGGESPMIKSPIIISMENHLYNDDCFNVFPKIRDSTVDLILVDLPYQCTALHWDHKIDLDKMWVQLKRIMKPNGQALFFCTTKFGFDLINANRKWFKCDIVWEKTKAVGHLASKKTLMRKHEMIYLFHSLVRPKDVKFAYNPQMTKGEPYSRGKLLNKNSTLYQSQVEYTHENLSGDRFPTSIIKLGNSADIKNRLHSTQKPVELCEWLIKTYSNEGDTVLDFTMGSGSTIVAAINTNRKYIGIEMDGEIYKKAEERIQKLLN